MMCLRCGNTDNPTSARQCARCSAVLPRVMDSDDFPSSSLDLQEGRQYLIPQQSYPTEYLYNLTCRAYEYIHQDASGTPLLEAYQAVRTRIEAFESSDLPPLLASLQLEQVAAPNDDYFSQVTYLFKRGVAIMREGFDLMDAFVESGETETLKAAIAKMQEGNDNLGLGRRLSEERSRP